MVSSLGTRFKNKFLRLKYFCIRTYVASFLSGQGISLESEPLEIFHWPFIRTKLPVFAVVQDSTICHYISPAVVLPNALLMKKQEEAYHRGDKSIKPSTGRLVSLSQADSILQIETDSTIIEIFRSLLSKNPKKNRQKPPIHSASYHLFQKCGKIERMEESYGITTTWNGGSFKQHPLNRPGLNRLLKDLTRKYKQHFSMRGISW